MAPATLGRAEVLLAPTPIREGRTRLRKCYGSFATTLLSYAMQKLRIVRALDETWSAGRWSLGVRSGYASARDRTERSSGFLESLVDTARDRFCAFARDFLPQR